MRSRICLQNELQSCSCTDVAKSTDAYSGFFFIAALLTNRLLSASNQERLKMLLFASSASNVELFSFAVDVSVFAFVWGRNRASAWQFLNPFLSQILKPKSDKCKHQRNRRADGSRNLSYQYTGLWSVKTIKRSRDKYGRSDWTVQTTARDSFSAVE